MSKQNRNRLGPGFRHLGHYGSVTSSSKSVLQTPYTFLSMGRGRAPPSPLEEPTPTEPRREVWPRQPHPQCVRGGQRARAPCLPGHEQVNPNHAPETPPSVTSAHTHDCVWSASRSPGAVRGQTHMFHGHGPSVQMLPPAARHRGPHQLSLPARQGRACPQPTAQLATSVSFVHRCLLFPFPAAPNGRSPLREDGAGRGGAAAHHASAGR